MYNGYFVFLSGEVVLVGIVSCCYVTLSEEIPHASDATLLKPEQTDYHFVVVKYKYIIFHSFYLPVLLHWFSFCPCALLVFIIHLFPSWRFYEYPSILLFLLLL